jgi:hypothetical protein
MTDEEGYGMTEVCAVVTRWYVRVDGHRGAPSERCLHPREAHEQQPGTGKWHCRDCFDWGADYHEYGGPDGNEVAVPCPQRDGVARAQLHRALVDEGPFSCPVCHDIGYVRPDGRPITEWTAIVSDVVPETSHMIQDDDVREILGKGD